MMSVIGALVALRHWLRLSARSRLRGERKVAAAPVTALRSSGNGGGTTQGRPIQTCAMPSSSCTSEMASKPNAP
jgi:putative membrane protein